MGKSAAMAKDHVTPSVPCSSAMLRHACDTYGSTSWCCLGKLATGTNEGTAERLVCSDLLCDSGIHASPQLRFQFECLASQTACRLCQSPPIASNSIENGPVTPTVQLDAKSVLLSAYIYLENAAKLAAIYRHL